MSIFKHLSDALRDLYQLKVSHDTVTRWSYIGAVQHLGIDSDRHLGHKFLSQYHNNNALDAKWLMFFYPMTPSLVRAMAGSFLSGRHSFSPP
jgi:hypothetical protein